MVVVSGTLTKWGDAVCFGVCGCGGFGGGCAGVRYVDGCPVWGGCAFGDGVRYVDEVGAVVLKCMSSKVDLHD